ncbi:hypothetical protein GCM10011318_21510 [Phaeocystidibacter marisrubri]|nr:hypothetical protein GCM10011318_21510 [Phaeocystidibacter marisrubri]
MNYFRGATSQVVRVTGIDEKENLALKIEVHPILILAFLFYAFIALFICVEAYQNTDYALVTSFFMSIFIVLSILLVFIFFEMKYTEQRLREIFISIEAA